MDKKNNNMCIVTKQHTSNYPNPIKLSNGEVVIVGQRYDGKADWEKWIYCFTPDRSLEGWVPEQIIKIEDKQGIILEKYIARELDVTIGKLLIKQKELNGWCWVKKVSTSEEGWVPLSNVMKVNEK